MPTDPPRAVFLSYARDDADAARRIAEALRAAGIEVWFDQSELRGGDAWDANIRRQIKECALFVPVISQHTRARAEGYFRREWKLGVERTHDMAEDVAFIVPIVVDDTPDAQSRVPDKFREVQWTRLPGGETPPAFVERVKALLAGGDVARASPGLHRPGEGGRPVGVETVGRETNATPKPRRASAWRWLAAAAVVIGAIVALALWQQWRKPENPASGLTPPVAEVRQLVQQALTLLRGANVVRADLETAEQFFEKAKALDPTDGEVWAIGAMIDTGYVGARYDTSDTRKGEARTKAARALKFAPNSFEARLAQAMVLNTVVAEPSVRPEAGRLVKSLLDEKPDDRWALIQKGKLLSLEGRNDEAVVYYRRANDPVGEGWTYLALGRLADAEAAADRAISAGFSVAGLLLKANIEVQLREDLEAAQAAIDQLPASELLEDQGAMRAAMIRFYRREPDKVLAIMRAVPQDWLWVNDAPWPKAEWTAWAHLTANRPAAAQTDWRAGLRLVEERLATRSNDPPLLYQKAWFLAFLGERDEAERSLQLYQQLRGQHENEITGDTALVYLYMFPGRHDEIVNLMAAELARNRSLRADLRYAPWWDPLRGDPRFEALLRETLPKGAKPFDDPKPEAGNQNRPAEPAKIDQKSIAVLPFANMSENKDASAFFADGMHEDVITDLALIRELRVVSRTTAETYRGTKKSLRQIGEELRVAYILEGSVRRIGNKVRVTGQLIDARTDGHVWAKSYDRDLTDVFAIQSELAQAIATALQAALSPQEKALLERRPTANLAAYDLFLKAREVRNQGAITPNSLQKQATLLRSAVTLDPEFALAWAELNYTCGLGYLNFHDTTDRTRAEAKTAIENAVRLAPDEPSVIRSLGDFHYFLQRDYARAMEQYEKFARLQPNEPTVYYSIGNVRRRQGRWAEAAANYRKAVQLDPGDRRPARQLVNVLTFCRRYEEAITEQRRFVALWPDALDERYVLAMLHFKASGSAQEMTEFFAALPPEQRESDPVLSFRREWARISGDFAEAVRLSARHASFDDFPADSGVGAVDAAVTLAAAGDRAAACARLPEVSANLRSRLELDPNNAVLWSELGKMEAILGHREEALRCVGRAMQLLPESLDALTGPGFRAALAFVHTWTGDKNAAIEEYARLLKGSPGGVIRDWSNVHSLKHGPWAWPLRDDPRFQALLADPKNNAPLF